MLFQKKKRHRRFIFSLFFVIKIFCGRRDLNSHERYSSDSKSEASTIPPRPLKSDIERNKQTL